MILLHYLLRTFVANGTSPGGQCFLIGAKSEFPFTRHCDEFPVLQKKNCSVSTDLKSELI